VGVQTDFQVRVGQAATGPVWRADELLQTVPRWQGRTMRWRKGTTGGLRQNCGAARGWRVTSATHRHEGWLVGERVPRGQPAERQYYWRHLPPHAALEERAGLAPRRHAVERCHEEAKGELGGDQYQGRVWSGLQRHTVTVMLAYSLWVCLAQQQRRRDRRQSRRRDLFSPLAEPPAQDPLCRAS
jgi:SRSO17 transposase